MLRIRAHARLQFGQPSLGGHDGGGSQHLGTTDRRLLSCFQQD